MFKTGYGLKDLRKISGECNLHITISCLALNQKQLNYKTSRLFHFQIVSHNEKRCLVFSNVSFLLTIS